MAFILDAAVFTLYMRDISYSSFLSTACGMLDYLVCETLEGAEQCVKYLREHNLGRASFIALNQAKMIK